MAFRFIGVSSTAITDGGSQAPTINGQTWSTSNLLNGDTCMYNYGRFMWNTSTDKWVGQGDVNIHSDVQSALNDIIVANKGEEVRGSIYDALALVDARTDMLDQDIRNDANDIVHSEFGLSVWYDFSSEDYTSNKNPAQIYDALSNNKCIIASIKYNNKYRYGMTCSFVEYDQYHYIMDAYAPTEDGENIEIFRITASTRTIPFIFEYTRTVVPISGGGGGSSDNYNLIFFSGGGASGTATCNLTYQELLTIHTVGAKSPIVYVGGSGPVRCGGDSAVYTETEDNVTNIHVTISYFPQYGGTSDTMEEYHFVYTSSSLTYTRVQRDYQQKLSAGTGISIDPVTNTISLDLPQAEGGGF